MKNPNFVPVNVTTLKTRGYNKKVQLDTINYIAQGFTGLITKKDKTGKVFLNQADVLQGLNTNLKVNEIEGRQILVTLTQGVTPLIDIHKGFEVNNFVITPTNYFWQNNK